MRDCAKGLPWFYPLTAEITALRDDVTNTVDANKKKKTGATTKKK